MSDYPNLLANLSEWEDEHVDALICDKTAEERNLDYKSQPYDHDHDGRRKLLKAITAMANAAGGLILFGVDEEEGTDGVPEKRAHVEDAESQRARMEQIASACIKERIPGLHFKVVGENPAAILIHVPQSVRAPHMYGLGKEHVYFYKRHGRENLPMSIDEIHESVIQTARYGERAEQFLLERLRRIISESAEFVNAEARGTSARPAVFVTATPIPLRSGSVDTDSPEAKNIVTGTTFAEMCPGADPRVFNSPFGPQFASRPFIFGRESLSRSWGGQAVRLFRNGHLECGRIAVPDNCRWPLSDDDWCLDQYVFMDTIFATVCLAREVARLITTCSAVTFAIGLTNFRNGYISPARPIDAWKTDDLMLAPPDVDLTFSVADLEDLLPVGKMLADRLLQCFGQEGSNLFIQHCGPLLRRPG